MNSADAHLQEPPDLWVQRLPRKYRDRAPRYELNGKHRLWIVDGRPFASDALHDQVHADGTFAGEPGARRIRDLDEDGIWAEAVYGNIGLQCLRFEDAEFALACARVYNDYVAEAFADWPQREIPIAVIPAGNPAAAAAEIERAATLGLRGVCMPMTMHDPPYSNEVYDIVWTTAEQCDVPVSFHFGTGVDPAASAATAHLESRGLAASFSRAVQVQQTVMPLMDTQIPQRLVGQLVGAGIFADHPTLSVVCVEANAGWLASLMEAMDCAWSCDGRSGSRDAVTRPQHLRWAHELKPSDYVRRQVKVTFQDEIAPLKFLDVTGTECLMWGSDFPHPEGTWPNSREAVASLFEGTAAEEMSAIVSDNLAQLYKISMPDQLLPIT